MERQRLLVLSTHADSPGQRFRIRTWAPYLARHGIDTTERPFATNSLQRLLLDRGHTAEKVWHTMLAFGAYAARPMRKARYQGVLVFREALPLGPPVVERSLGRDGSPPMIYDIDDPIFLGPVGSSVAWLRAADKWKTICSLSALTICINEMIADEVRSYAQRVAVIPNAIDLSRYPMRPMSDGADSVVFGYSGSYSTVGQLSEIRAALGRVARVARIKVHVVGGDPGLSIERAPVILRRWSAVDEVKLLHEFDVGLAPAPLDQWSKYKSFVKVLLYMGVGLPIVASRTGLPTRIIRDGDNGFLATSEDEWVEKLLLLARSPDLRRSMGEAARRTIEADFDLSAVLPRVERLFGGVMRAPGAVS